MGSGQSSATPGGFRCFKVSAGSPAYESGLEVFFDFVVEIGGSRLESDDKELYRKIHEAENKETKLVVYNIRTGESRDVWITPRRWGGVGLVGAVFRYDSLDQGENQGFRVLEVFPNSPADQAGLIPLKDFLLGTMEVMFRDMDELAETVNLCRGKNLVLYVYNMETEMIREVSITPNTGWGGDGALGADVRTGLLHRIPAPHRSSQRADTSQEGPAQPGEGAYTPQGAPSPEPGPPAEQPAGEGASRGTLAPCPPPAESAEDRGAAPVPPGS